MPSTRERPAKMGPTDRGGPHRRGPPAQAAYAAMKESQARRTLQQQRAAFATAFRPETWLEAPTPAEVLAARRRVGHSQKQAAAVIGSGRQQTWAEYEATDADVKTPKWRMPAQLDKPVQQKRRVQRPMPVLLWNWYLLLTDQHPLWSVSVRQSQALPAEAGAAEQIRSERG